ncbi:MAG: hypothetical protein ACRBBP_00620 [Bdellovibrionales bacterium]
MFRLVLALTVYVFCSYSAYAQERCTVYHNETLPLEIKDSTIGSSFKQANNLNFSKALNNSSIFASFSEQNIYFSLTNGAETPGSLWEPIVLKFEDSTHFKSQLSCHRIKELVSDGHIIRKASLELQKYIFNRPSETALGELIIILEWAYLKYQKNISIDYHKAIERYNSILAQTSEIQKQSSSERFFVDWRSVMKVVYLDDKEDINYCTESTLLTDALLNGCTNCIGETSLFLSLFVDSKFSAPSGWKLGTQVFRDHIRPVVYNTEASKTFDLVYGVSEDNRAAIFKWRDLFQSLLKGFSAFTHSTEMRRINRAGTSYVHRDWSCHIGQNNFDLGYETRNQAYHFGALATCDTFSDSDILKNNDPIDTSNRLNPQSSISRGAYSESIGQDSKQVDRINLTLFTDTYIKPEVLNNLIPEEADLVRRFQNGDSQALSLLKNKINAQLVFDGRNIRKGLLEKYDGFFEEFEFALYNILISPIVTKLTPYQLEPISLFYEDNYLILSFSTPEIEAHFKNLSTPQRYIQAMESLEKLVQESSQNLFPNAFDVNNLKSSIILQSQQIIVLNSQINYLSNLLSLYLRSAPWIIYKSHPFFWVFEYNSTESNRLNIIEKIKDFKVYIDQHPLEFLKAISEAGLELNNSGMSIQLFPKPNLPDLNNPTSESSRLKLILNSDIELTYKGFTDYLLFNDKFFFTAEANENERPPFALRPYNPLKLNEIKEIEAVDSLPEVNLPQIRLEPCKDGESGIVQRGLFYIECELTPQEVQIAQNERDGFIDGADNTSFSGAPIEQDVLNHTPLEDQTEVTEGIPFVELSEEELRERLIDPRQEVVLSHLDWRTLVPLIKSYSEIKYPFALHHLQRNSIQQLINPPLTISTVTSTSSSSAIDPLEMQYLLEGLANPLYSNLISLPKVKKSEVADYTISPLFNRDSEETKHDFIQQFSLKAEEIMLTEQEREVPIYFTSSLHEEIIYLEAVNKLKFGWYFKEMRQPRSAEGYHHSPHTNVEDSMDILFEKIFRNN